MFSLRVLTVQFFHLKASFTRHYKACERIRTCRKCQQLQGSTKDCEAALSTQDRVMHATHKVLFLALSDISSLSFLNRNFFFVRYNYDAMARVRKKVSVKLKQLCSPLTFFS